MTYVRVGARWAYVCFIIDLYNREIIGLSIGWHKTTELVKQALQTIPYALNKVQIFHSDRGKEFDNALIEDVLTAFDIKRSLSQAGCPYDNSVAESTYRAFKIEFVYQGQFSILEELAIKTRGYVHWWNYHRIHSSPNYQIPIALRIIA